MKFSIMILPIALVLTACQVAVAPPANPAAPTNTVSTLEEVASRTLLIMFNDNVNRDAVDAIITSHQGVITHHFDAINGIAVRFATGTNIDEVSRRLKAVQGVSSVEKDSVMQITPIRPGI